jgi:class 3 adenylate cyclase
MCASCATELPAGAKFCKECGAPVGTSTPTTSPTPAPESYTPKHLAERIINSKAALEGERKQVTVLFADLKGSMELLADRDPEEARKLLDPVLQHMMEAVHRYEGTVNQVMGDGIMALFGAPLAHEDHAVRACYAALRMQESVKRYAERVRREQGVTVRIRLGLNSGEVVVRSIGSDLHMDYTAVGQTTHLAARMEQLADPGAILLSPETLALAEGFVQVISLGPMAVKGLAVPVEVYELTGIGAARSRLQAAAARGLSPFVGRDVEIEQLRRAVDQARQGRGQVAAIVGEPGVGKSRLIFELTHSPRVKGWLVLEAGASSHGKATSYLPISTALRSYFTVGERDTYEDMRGRIRARLSALGESLWPAAAAFEALLGVPVEDARWQGIEPRQRRQHTLEAVRHLILRESQIQPLLLVLEDLHWIDAETQAWLDGLVDGLPAARLLLLVPIAPSTSTPGATGPTTRSSASTRSCAKGPRISCRRCWAPTPSWPRCGHCSSSGRMATRSFWKRACGPSWRRRPLVGERGAYRLAQALDHVQVPSHGPGHPGSRIDRLPGAEKAAIAVGRRHRKGRPFLLLHAVAVMNPRGRAPPASRLQQSSEFLYTRPASLPDSEYTFKHALTQEVA